VKAFHGPAGAGGRVNPTGVLEVMTGNTVPSFQYRDNEAVGAAWQFIFSRPEQGWKRLASPCQTDAMLSLR